MILAQKSEIKSKGFNVTIKTLYTLEKFPWQNKTKSFRVRDVGVHQWGIKSNIVL